MLHIFLKTNLIPEAPKADDGNEKFFATKYGRLLTSIRSSITLTKSGTKSGVVPDGPTGNPRGPKPKNPVHWVAVMLFSLSKR